MTLDYGNYGIFLIMGNARFISSTVVNCYPEPKYLIFGSLDPFRVSTAPTSNQTFQDPLISGRYLTSYSWGLGLLAFVGIVGFAVLAFDSLLPQPGPKKFKLSKIELIYKATKFKVPPFTI